MKFFLMICTLGFMLSCDSGETADEHALKIYIDETGVVKMNGRVVTIDELNDQLKQLDKEDALIYYSRANIEENPHENAMLVIALISKYDYPISFFTDETFTEPVKLQ